MEIYKNHNEVAQRFFQILDKITLKSYGLTCY